MQERRVYLNNKTMKKIALIFFAGVAMLSTSCKKYLDINNNPNQATSATPELILPQAMTGTAAVLNNYNSYGSQIVGYSANAGGYGGFGSSITYDFSSSDFAGLWSSTYDNLEDYQAILNQTASQMPAYSYFNAVARIMKAYDFQLLVDTYNDVPYTDALQGADKLTPTYANAATVYVNIANDLDSAIKIINDTRGVTGVKPLGTSDVLFGGDVDIWKQFANTIKLRLIVRAKDKAQFTNTTFDAVGFLTSDALINPGYTRDNGRQNPAWNTWAFGYTGTAGNKAWMPATYVFGYYNGSILSDQGRGKAVYYKYPSTGTNRLGHEGIDIQASPAGSFWYSSNNRDGASSGNSVGILKGPEAGYPIMLAAESYFLQSEAALRGITTGDAKTLFEEGVLASFTYLYKTPDGTVQGNPENDVAAYKTANATSALVNFDLATTTAKKIEAIITQKYVALNYINGQESWNEYRRTHYPSIIPGGSAYQTFASTVSVSTRPDKLPTRILYPTSEGAYNPTNLPKGITPFTSFIFWALQ